MSDHNVIVKLNKSEDLVEFKNSKNEFKLTCVNSAIGASTLIMLMTFIMSVIEFSTDYFMVSVLMYVMKRMLTHYKYSAIEEIVEDSKNNL